MIKHQNGKSKPIFKENTMRLDELLTMDDNILNQVLQTIGLNKLNTLRIINNI